MENAFTIIYLVNNTSKDLENINIRVDGIKEEKTWKKIKAGDVISKYLLDARYHGDKDIFLYYVDNNGEKHEHKIIENFDISVVTNFKVRIQGIIENGDFNIEVEEER